MSSSSPVGGGKEGGGSSSKTSSTIAAVVVDTEWRMQVKQSYRNTQVRQAAKVLANLEPGATEASKLRLAMQFEDSIFTVASSLSDYHKKLTKRLNKLQKTYVPSTATSDASTSADSLQKKKEKVVQDLITKYGNDVRYVVDNAATAVSEMRDKYGEEKAVQLQQHTDSAKLWAIDLGILPESEGSIPKPNMNMSDSHLERLINHLEKRLNNIRSHTVKLVHPDLFLQESLQRIQDEFKDKGRVVRIQADNMRKRYEQLQHVMASQQSQPNTLTTTMMVDSDETFDPNKLMIQALEQASKPVQNVSDGTVQGRATNKSDSSSAMKKNSSSMLQQQQQQIEWEIRKQNALLHLEKMRAASTIFVAYLCIPDKYTVPQPNVLANAHKIAMEGIEVVQRVMQDLRNTNTTTTTNRSTTTSANEQTTGSRTVTTSSVQLHDAWLKHIVIPTKDVILLDTDNPSTSDTATTITQQRPGTIVLRTRVLCTMGRKIPSNFIVALQNKGVTLVRPTYGSTYAQLQLEQAFVVQIYFVPLLVTYRANTNKEESADGGSLLSASSTTRQWPPIHEGLSNRSKNDETLSVNGIVKGKYKSVGWMIEDNLYDASAYATKTLRQFFTKTLQANNEFEIELVEASAILEFVQLVRDTYLPPNEQNHHNNKSNKDEMIA